MHLLFINPHGNFDSHESRMGEHPDFGGQLIYVRELAMAMVDMGHTVDIATRKIDDRNWPEFAAPIEVVAGYEPGLRILRFECGGPNFIRKEELWPHLNEFVDNVENFYGDQLPDFVTSHYGDGGYCAALIKSRTGINFSFTGHSLGAQKLDQVGTTIENWPEIQERYKFAQRVDADRIAMQAAKFVVVSTKQERFEQYSHPLYHGAAKPTDPRFNVIPPGIKTEIFKTDTGPEDNKVRKLIESKVPDHKPSVVVSSRLDDKKNIIGVVAAFARLEKLQQLASLVICLKGVEDPFADLKTLTSQDQAVLAPILELITSAGIASNVHFLNLDGQADLASTYRVLAEKGSVFALTAFYEPFGLALTEAAACGLGCVATKNGGPSEIFADGSGVLVDPYSSEDIANGIVEALSNQVALTTKSGYVIAKKYTWAKTAQAYLALINTQLSASSEEPPPPNANALIERYLAART